MDRLKVVLFSIINSYETTSTDYLIAKYILDNYDQLDSKSISEFADDCFVSPASISRFCRNAGFKDFNEVKTQISRRVPNDVKFSIDQQILMGTDEDVHAFLDSFMLSYMQFMKYLDVKKINQLVIDIDEAEHVAAFGAMHSLNAALTLQYDLNTSGKLISSFPNQQEQNKFLRTIPDHSLIIVFSERGHHLDRIMSDDKAIATLIKKKVKLVLITHNNDYKSNLIYDYIIYCHAPADYATHPTMFLLLARIIALKYRSIALKKQNVKV